MLSVFGLFVDSCNIDGMFSFSINSAESLFLYASNLAYIEKLDTESYSCKRMGSWVREVLFNKSRSQLLNSIAELIGVKEF